MQSLLQFLESYQVGSPRASYKQPRSKSEEIEIAKAAPLYQMTQYEGWRIEPTIHAAAQSYDRRPDFEYNTWKEMHRRVVKSLNAMMPKRTGEYLFYSRSFQQGYVVAVDFARKLIKIITVLPKGRNNPMPGTHLLMIEGIQIELIDTIEID